jgi:hypothetical protein
VVVPEVIFTGEQLYVPKAEYPDRRKFIDEFYKSFDIAASAPWNMSSVPLPPKDSVQSNLSYSDQLFVFAKYLINKIAPIILNELYRKEGYDPVSGVDYNYNGKANFLSALIPNNLEECKAISDIIGCYYKESMHDKKVESVGSHALVMLRNACYGTLHAVTYAAYPILFASMSNPEATWKSTIEMLECISPFYDSDNSGMSGARDNPTSRAKHRGKTGGTMRHKSARDNATFTGKPMRNGGDGPTGLVELFYRRIESYFPESTPVQIPPLNSVHPSANQIDQAFIFADYAARKILPIVLDAVKVSGGRKLRNLPTIVGYDSLKEALKATEAVSAQMVGTQDFWLAAYAASHAVSTVTILDEFPDHDISEDTIDYHSIEGMVATDTAIVVGIAAKLNPNATWKAVREMLAELTTVRSNKSTLKRKASPKKVRHNPVEFSILRKDTKEPESFHNIDANIRRHFPDDWVDPNDLSEMERDLGAEWYYGWYEWIQVGHTFKDIVAKIKKAAGMERNNYSEGPKKGSREEYYERLIAIYNWLDRKYTLRTKHVSLR